MCDRPLAGRLCSKLGVCVATIGWCVCRTDQMSGGRVAPRIRKAGVMGVFEWLRGAITPRQNYPTQYGQRPSGIAVPSRIVRFRRGRVF